MSSDLQLQLELMGFARDTGATAQHELWHFLYGINSPYIGAGFVQDCWREYRRVPWTKTCG